MNQPADLKTTWQWIQEYTQGRQHSSMLGCQLSRYQRFQLSIYPETSFLTYADRTEPIGHWMKQRASKLARCTAECELGRVKGFTSCLFQQGRIEHDVFFYISAPAVLRGNLPNLHLQRNLQRQIQVFEAQLSSTVRHSAVQVAHKWNLYLNLQTSEGLAEDNECLVFAFLQHLARLSPSEQTYLAWVRGLDRFFEFRVQRGEMHQNLLPDWLKRYRSRSALFRVLATSSTASLPQVLRQPFFQSALATELQDFLQHQRDRGKRYESTVYLLRVLDRVLQRLKIEGPSEIGPSLIEAYLCENKPSPRTRNKRLWMLQIFIRFLIRRGFSCATDIEGWPVLNEPNFRPHLFSLSEVGQLLAEFDRRAQANPASQGLWKGAETIFYLLYACGLRLSEPLKLRNQDVDFEQMALFIAHTKFYKQRWVPVSQGAMRRLKAYLELRNGLFPGRTDGQDAFFLNSRGRAFTKGPLQHYFRCIRESLDIVCRGSLAAARIHDLRHSFAVSRLYQWYSEGAKVQNKLPLLAAYMGHINYHCTEVYLHVAEDLLRQGGRRFEAHFTQIIQKRIPDEDS